MQSITVSLWDLEQISPLQGGKIEFEIQKHVSRIPIEKKRVWMTSSAPIWGVEAMMFNDRLSIAFFRTFDIFHIFHIFHSIIVWIITEIVSHDSS